MNEYDKADFNGIYEGKSLLESADVTNVPWEIGEPQPIVCEILENMTPGKLLDVGCGLGRNAKAASERGYNVVAIDVASSAISICNSLYHGSGIDFRVCDASDTGMESGFDVILDSAAFHAIPSEKRDKYLGEMYRLASEKGVFHLITFAPSMRGMPKPLSSDLSDVSKAVEETGWSIRLAERMDYLGNNDAIADFRDKKKLNIELDDKGRTKLPVWHLVMQKSI